MTTPAESAQGENSAIPVDMQRSDAIFFGISKGDAVDAEEIGSYYKHSRSHDPEDAPRLAAARSVMPDVSKAERGSASAERRHSLYVSAAAPAPGVDRLGVGCVREQP